MTQPDLGKKLTAFRKEQNLTQEELVELCNVSVRTIQRIEAGEVLPRTSTVKIILAALGKEFSAIYENDARADRGAKNWTKDLFLSGSDKNNQKIKSVLQIAWIAGVVYLAMLLLETGLEHLRSIDALEESGKAFYSVTKVFLFITFLFFMQGYLALGQLFENYLLRVSSYLYCGVFFLTTAVDILSLYLVNDDTVLWAILGAETIAFGGLAVIFGIALLRLQDSMGRISKVAGVLEIIMGCLFISVLLAFVGLLILIPVVILEIVILYKGYEFLTEEQS